MEYQGFRFRIDASSCVMEDSEWLAILAKSSVTWFGTTVDNSIPSSIGDWISSYGSSHYDRTYIKKGTAMVEFCVPQGPIPKILKDVLSNRSVELHFSIKQGEVYFPPCEVEDARIGWEKLTPSGVDNFFFAKNERENKFIVIVKCLGSRGEFSFPNKDYYKGDDFEYFLNQVWKYKKYFPYLEKELLEREKQEKINAENEALRAENENLRKENEDFRKKKLQLRVAISRATADLWDSRRITKSRKLKEIRENLEKVLNY